MSKLIYIIIKGIVHVYKVNFIIILSYKYDYMALPFYTSLK